LKKQGRKQLKPGDVVEFNGQKIIVDDDFAEPEL
jgi:hypothetical protein